MSIQVQVSNYSLHVEVTLLVMIYTPYVTPAPIGLNVNMCAYNKHTYPDAVYYLFWSVYTTYRILLLSGKVCIPRNTYTQ